MSRAQIVSQAGSRMSSSLQEMRLLILRLLVPHVSLRSTSSRPCRDPLSLSREAAGTTGILKAVIITILQNEEMVITSVVMSAFGAIGVAR